MLHLYSEIVDIDDEKKIKHSNNLYFHFYK